MWYGLQLDVWPEAITDIDDDSFSADIKEHCTKKCGDFYVKLTHIAGGFGKGSDTKEEIFKQLGKAVAKGEAIPGVFLPYDMTHSGSPCKSNLYISLVDRMSLIFNPNLY